jgi:hypothetical protein
VELQRVSGSLDLVSERLQKGRGNARQTACDTKIIDTPDLKPTATLALSASDLKLSVTMALTYMQPLVTVAVTESLARTPPFSTSSEIWTFQDLHVVEKAERHLTQSHWPVP